MVENCCASVAVGLVPSVRSLRPATTSVTSSLAADLASAGSLEKRTEVLTEFHRRHLPHYALNAQRIDLILP